MNIKALLARLSEPSTWAGFAGLAIVFGAPGATVSAVVQTIVGVASVAAVVLPEGKK